MILRDQIKEVFRLSNLTKKCVAVPLYRQFSNEKDLPESYIEREKEREFSSILKSFATKKSQFLELHRLNPMTVSPQRFREWKEKVKREAEIQQQAFIEERHKILGSDLATAHFIVFRGGKVKFTNSEKWIELNKEEEACPELPNKFVRGLYLECVDASNTKIRYEGLKNFTNLTRLKWLSFSNCEHVDDWFLDCISGEFSNNLEYLDVSNCKNVTEHGLSCIYRLRNLKTLKISNSQDTRSFEYMCLLLEDNIPNLSIEGIKYLDIVEETV